MKRRAPKTTPAKQVKQAKRVRSDAEERKIHEIEDRLREVDWRELSFVGAELASIPGMRKEPFEFPALEKELKEGVLANKNHPIYIFLVCEPVYCDDQVVPVPVIIAFDSTVPPPSLYAHDSVQSQESSSRALNALGGRPIDMRQAQLAWVPYVPEGLEEAAYTRGVHIPVTCLTWGGRSARTKKMNEDQLHYIEYINPYILIPKHCASLTKPEVLSVNFTWKYEGKSIEMIYDKEVDTIPEFQADIIEKYQLDEKAKGPIKDALKEAFVKARADCDAQWNELQSHLAALSPSHKAALDSAKVYKFYPSSYKIDLTPFRAPKVNRYYGNADKVFGGEKRKKTEEDIEIEKEEQEENKRMEEEKKKAEQKKLADEKRAEEKKKAREAEAKKKIKADAKKVAKKVAAKKASPKKAAPKKAAPKKVDDKKAGKKAAPKKAAPKKEEAPKKAAPKKEEAPKKVAPKEEEAPKKVAPKKEEPPKKAAPKKEELPKRACAKKADTKKETVKKETKAVAKKDDKKKETKKTGKK